VAIGEHVYDGLGQAHMLRGFGEQGEDRALDGLDGPFTYEYDALGNLTRQQEPQHERRPACSRPA
jgi:hypothetical protein